MRPKIHIWCQHYLCAGRPPGLRWLPVCELLLGAIMLTVKATSFNGPCCGDNHPDDHSSQVSVINYRQSGTLDHMNIPNTNWIPQGIHLHRDHTKRGKLNGITTGTLTMDSKHFAILVHGAVVGAKPLQVQGVRSQRFATMGHSREDTGRVPFATHLRWEVPGGEDRQ